MSAAIAPTLPVMPSGSPPLLEARQLTKNFTVGKTMMPGSGRVLHAVDGIDLKVSPGETLGLVVNRAVASRRWAVA